VGNPCEVPTEDVVPFARKNRRYVVLFANEINESLIQQLPDDSLSQGKTFTEGSLREHAIGRPEDMEHRRYVMVSQVQKSIEVEILELGPTVRHRLILARTLPVILPAYWATPLGASQQR
jgi:hypothetical protein